MSLFLRYRLLLAIVFLTGFLIGSLTSCGQKGALYLTTDTKPVTSQEHNAGTSTTTPAPKNQTTETTVTPDKVDTTK